MRIHLILETPSTGPPWACAEIRLLRPYQHALMRRHASITVGPGLPSTPVDVVVMQRAGCPDMPFADVTALLRDMRRRHVRFVYDLDDDLLSAHALPMIEQAIAPIRAKIRMFLREADMTVVSTASLADRVRHLTPRVCVWENAIDEALVIRTKASRDENEGADVGYFGTHSHLPDLLAVIESLEAAFDLMPGRPTVELCGISDDFRIDELFAARCAVSILPVDGDYPSFLTGLQSRAPWKAGLAPLTDTVFNRSKSDIKFLDYAIAGIAGVYADCPAYASVLDGQTGLKAPLSGFGAAVRRLLEDHDLRRHVRATARQHVMDHRTLNHCVPALWDMLRQVL